MRRAATVALLAAGVIAILGAAGKPVDKPAAKPAAKSAVKPAAKPVAKPAEKPADKLVEVPASPVTELKPTIPLAIEQEVGSVRELTLEAGQNRLLVLTEPIARVSVADPSIADLKVITPTQLLLTAKTVGSTDMTVWTRADAPLVVALLVIRNLSGLRKQLTEIFPEEKINVSTAGDMVVLTGEVSDIRLPERIAEVAKLHAEKVANLVRVSGDQQVQLEVKFAEVSRSALREMGINFYHQGANYVGGGGIYSARTAAGQVITTGATQSLTGRAVGTAPQVPGQPFGDAFSVFFNNYNSVFPFSVMLNMLETKGLAKVLAEPTLVTLSGQEAKFLAGGEIPIPMSSGLGQVSVMWKKFGVQLRFTPTVVKNDLIHLQMYTEVSDLDPRASVTVGGYTIPGLTSRQGETTVRMADGQSFAIAGLTSDTVRSQIERFPGLGHIPILGALFSSTQWRREETELLVVVTPRLARPTAAHDAPPLPTDYEIYDTGAFNLFFLGWDAYEKDDKDDNKPVQSSATKQGSSDGRGPSGAVGFSSETAAR